MASREIDLDHPNSRADDFCPRCNAFPRTTVPAEGYNPDNQHAAFRRCLTCNQVWEDHFDHTPDNGDLKGEFYKTRFDDGEQRLLYAHVEGTNVGYPGQTSKTGRQVSFWSFFHQWQSDEPRRVGPEYPSRETLLAAMEKYGADFGFEDVPMAATAQEKGERHTDLGNVLYIRIYTPNYQKLGWEHVWAVFKDRYPGRWAVQFFPPEDEVINEQNIYHLFVLDHKPRGFNIKPGSY